MKLIYFSVVLICLTYSIESKKLLIFQKDLYTNLDKYKNLFKTPNTTIDVMINKFTYPKKRYDGFIIPGGNSSIIDRTTEYWKFVDFVLKTNKPVFAICLGFQHVIKYYVPHIIQEKCDMVNLIVENKMHNHKWCVSNYYTNELYKRFYLDYYMYENKLYIGVIENDHIIGTIFHPEKQIKLTALENVLLEKFFNML